LAESTAERATVGFPWSTEGQALEAASVLAPEQGLLADTDSALLGQAMATTAVRQLREDHAEHEYMQFVAAHPRWETSPYDSPLTADYGSSGSLADLFRQIGHDERVHKDDSLRRMREARFR
jgi:hypothetical protein